MAAALLDYVAFEANACEKLIEFYIAVFLSCRAKQPVRKMVTTKRKNLPQFQRKQQQQLLQVLRQTNFSFNNSLANLLSVPLLLAGGSLCDS